MDFLKLHILMTTQTECNHLGVSSNTEFKLRMVVALDIKCVTKCPVSSKTVFYGNKVIHL